LLLAGGVATAEWGGNDGIFNPGPSDRTQLTNVVSYLGRIAGALERIDQKLAAQQAAQKAK